MSPLFKPMRQTAALWAVFLLAFSQHSLGAGKDDWYGEKLIPGPVAAQVLRVIDGDTIVVRARIWLDQDLKTGIRLRGVDAPELKGKCQDEKAHARKARDFVMGKVDGQIVRLHDIYYDKYARRYVARVELLDGEDLSAAILEAGLGRPYGGGKRESWCSD